MAEYRERNDEAPYRSLEPEAQPNSLLALLPQGAKVEPYQIIELRVIVPEGWSAVKEQRLVTLVHDCISDLQHEVCTRYDGARVEIH